MKIGFVGLGIMGKPMAVNLINAGHELYVCDVVKENVDYVCEKGAVACATPKEVAEKCTLVLTMLPNSPHVKEVILGENGVLDGIQADSIIVDMSSIDPTVSVELEKEVAKAGGHMIDAPVSGGEPKAIDGSLSFMCGGEQEIFDKVKDILALMGASVVLVGEIGSGNVTKLANQIIVAINIAAVSEAFTLASKVGVNPKNVYDAIRGGLAGSTVMDAKVPMMLARNFDPGFRIELHIKDLMNAVNAAESVGMDLPFAEKALDIMKVLREQGKEKNDHSAMVQWYEQQNDVEVK